jgi:tetratricopeptide (TPR) repeat protein
MEESMKKQILAIKTLVIFIFAIIAFTIYLNSISSPFFFDDFRNIRDNKNVAINNLFPGTLKKAAFNKTSGLRPLSYLSFALNHYFSGVDTTSYHVVNVTIHIINAFLIYLIILALFDYGAADDEKKNRLAVSAFFTALFWLVTPLNSQAVIYIVQRMTLLMTLFFLLAFYTYLLGRKKKKTVYFILSGVFFLMSILSKQNGVTFPLVIVLHELIFVQKGNIKSITKKENIIFVSVFLILLVIFFTYKTAIFKSISRGYMTRDFTMFERTITQLRVFVYYLSLLILPLPGRLSMTHTVIKSTSLISPITTLFSFIFINILFITAIVRMKKQPYLSFAILWFFVTKSVESTILPLEMAYEHRMYLPGIFLIGAFVNFVTNIFYDKNKVKVTAVFCGIAIAFGAMTEMRGRVWENGITLWSDVLSNYPDDGRASFNLGTNYYKKKMYEEAEPCFVNAIKSKRSNLNKALSYSLSSAYQKLARTQHKLGRPDEAIKNYMKAIEDDEKSPLTYNNLGMIYIEKGDYEKALDCFNNAVEFTHSYFSSIPGYNKNAMLAEAYNNLSVVQLKLEKYVEAKQSIMMAITADADNPILYEKLGKLFFKEKNYNDAIKMYKKAIRLSPSSEVFYQDLGTLYYFLNDYDNALHYFNKVIKLNPEDSDAYNSIAVIYAKKGADKKALNYFNKALYYDPNNVSIKKNIQKLIKKKLKKQP